MRGVIHGADMTQQRAHARHCNIISVDCVCVCVRVVYLYLKSDGRFSIVKKNLHLYTLQSVWFMPRKCSLLWFSCGSILSFDRQKENSKFICQEEECFRVGFAR